MAATIVVVRCGRQRSLVRSFQVLRVALALSPGLRLRAPSVVCESSSIRISIRASFYVDRRHVGLSACDLHVVIRFARLTVSAVYELGPWLADCSGFLVRTDENRDFCGLAIMPNS